jgi:hypothetical protein
MKLSGGRIALTFVPTVLVLILLVGQLPQALSQNAPTPDAACKAYVQKFYDYYLKEAGRESKESADMRAIKSKTFAFSEELKSQLKADEAAAAKSPGEIVGLDFDPFLNAQDLMQHYVAENVSHKGDNFLVSVYAVSDGKKEAKPAVTPELALKNNQLTFVNFHYGKSDTPDNENLLLVLKALRAERAKHK